MLKSQTKRCFICIILAVLFSHLFVIPALAVDIIDTFNKYKEVPDKVEKIEKVVEDSKKEIQGLQKQIKDLESEKQALNKKYQDLEKENDDLKKQLNESKHAYIPFVTAIIMIVIFIAVLRYIIRRVRNLGKRAGDK